MIKSDFRAAGVGPAAPEYEVRSKRIEDRWYRIWRVNDQFECECPASVFRHKCEHVKLINELVTRVRQPQKAGVAGSLPAIDYGK